uniref:Uncharacterized protein n=1 Tax=Arundo donax TaxID=35708 RepID=A0A0A9A435_ARUDO
MHVDRRGQWPWPVTGPDGAVGECIVMDEHAEAWNGARGDGGSGGRRLHGHACWDRNCFRPSRRGYFLQDFGSDFGYVTCCSLFPYFSFPL